MIFYFSGTGNSRHAALALSHAGEKVFNIADCIHEQSFYFSISAEETVGFVCPVYFGDLPIMVRDFVQKVAFDREPAYLYAVFTCGSSSFLCQEILQKLLAERGLLLHAAWEVHMVANYVVMYEIASQEDQDRILSAAEMQLGLIKDELWEQNGHLIPITEESRKIAAEMAPMYLEAVKTHKFWIDDTCIGCGTCASRCPVQAITMLDGYPSWNTGTCQHCMSCIRCGAVEYGVTTHGRKRYTHPDLRKKKPDGSAHCH